MTADAAFNLSDTPAVMRICGLFLFCVCVLCLYTLLAYKHTNKTEEIDEESGRNVESRALLLIYCGYALYLPASLPANLHREKDVGLLNRQVKRNKLVKTKI